MGKPAVEGGIEEGFAQLMKGDSVTFFIQVGKFFDYYLDKDIPTYLDRDKDMKITMRLLNIESPKAYDKRKVFELIQAESNELEIMEQITEEWRLSHDSVYINYNIVMVL